MYALPLQAAKTGLARVRLPAVVVPAALGAAAAVVCLLHVRATPINWDAVQFELALRDFNLRAHQPHPPGYILYVLAARAVNLLVADPSLALSLLSVLCAGLSVPLFYWLALQVCEDSGVALGASLLLLTSPLALYYGSVGLTYAPELLASLGVAALAWKVKTLKCLDVQPFGPLHVSRFTFHYSVVLLGVALGLAGGVRQTSLLLLLPLCLWALWGFGRAAWIAFVLPLGVVCLLWLVPLLILSGGPGAYLHENALLAGVISSKTSVFRAGIEGLALNLGFGALALGAGLAFAVISLGVWASRVVRFSLSRDVKAFVAWWALPGLLFYALSHVGQYGYVLALLPPLFLLSALATRVAAERPAKRYSMTGSAAGVLLCALPALLSVGYFTLAQGPVTAANIAGSDAHWKALRAALDKMDPESTVLVASNEWAGSFRQAGYLLPQFHTYSAGEPQGRALGWLYTAYGGRSNYALPYPPVRSSQLLPPGTRTVVVLDTELAHRFAPGQDFRQLSLADGSLVHILHSADADIAALTLGAEGLLGVKNP